MSLPEPIFALLPDVGGWEMMLVLFVVLLLFGGDKMPQLAKGIGKSIREFKRAAGDVEREIKRAIDEVPDGPDVPKIPNLPNLAKDLLNPPAAPAAPKPASPPAPTSVARTSPPPAPPAPPSSGDTPPP